jgi:RNA polymerase sigma factor (sigma-70 family)
VIPRHDIVRLVRSAQRGNPGAWERLVAEFSPLLRRVIHGYGLRGHDLDDALQETWVRAWSHVGTVREPAAVAGWLITIARRNAMRIRQHELREVPVELPGEDEGAAGMPLEDEVILAHRAAAVRRAVERLPSHQRTLLEALLGDSGGGYREVADEIGVPIGSIGPTRLRSLERLRNDPTLVQEVAV